MSSEPMRCYRHPDRETRVSCATCGRPICTDCMVPTDVGIKCPEDAKLPRHARAGAMRPRQLAKSLLAGAGVALAGFPVVYTIFQIGFLTLLLSLAAGYGAGTLIHRAGGRNGGPPAMAISGVSVAIPYLVLLAPELLVGGLPVIRLAAAAIAVVAAVYTSR
ncbi:hypothetical protein RxyAA322_00650 [Rubrobacter xylanophilus]|uniref:B box-type domain-containing protein n=1 Tax=Rubrobacter xylanophilus TaxID=49319 RepID=A0A510HE60_9ACTN|nr:B-box zinc finger protein [Rubrobacter xylanophilus]BBL78211.1 hypothetical protein RxyAA322_00650 [Rubrobacter xylanophilus]